jgi:hypothetical protein
VPKQRGRHGAQHSQRYEEAFTRLAAIPDTAFILTDPKDLIRADRLVVLVRVGEAHPESGTVLACGVQLCGAEHTIENHKASVTQLPYSRGVEHSRARWAAVVSGCIGRAFAVQDLGDERCGHQAAPAQGRTYLPGDSLARANDGLHVRRLSRAISEELRPFAAILF